MKLLAKLINYIFNKKQPVVRSTQPHPICVTAQHEHLEVEGVDEIVLSPEEYFEYTSSRGAFNSRSSKTDFEMK